MTAKKGHQTDSPPTGLLRLPNETLYDIVPFLNPADLRRLGEVNRRLYFFVEDYPARYNRGLVALPNELKLEIAQHLGNLKDRSRLARASHRFYPLIMDSILRHDIRYSESSLLYFAVKENLKGMARRILHLGGDVNTQCKSRFRTEGRKWRQSLLACAAFLGQKRMVKMLLENGADHYADGKRFPLMVAIARRHENVALMLSQELDPVDAPLQDSGLTALQMACGMKLKNLVRYFLERGSSDLTIALFCVVLRKGAKDGFYKRELHEDVYQIVLMLLQHGANTDTRIERRGLPPVTARIMASRHPDPRVKNLFFKGTGSSEPKEPASHVGRPWMVWSEDEALSFYEFRSEASPSQDSHYARLCDFLKGTNEEPPTAMDGELFSVIQGPGYQGIDYEDYTLTASNAAHFLEVEECMGRNNPWTLLHYRLSHNLVLQSQVLGTELMICGPTYQLRFLHALLRFIRLPFVIQVSFHKK